MSIVAKSSDRAFVPAPDGLHAGTCLSVDDLGMVPTAWGEKRKVRFAWTLGVIDVETGQPFEVRRSYNNTLHEKSTLRRDVESWIGRRLTSAELRGFDLTALVGAPCQVQILRGEGDDGTVYANVQAVMPPAATRRALLPARAGAPIAATLPAATAAFLADADDDAPEGYAAWLAGLRTAAAIGTAMLREQYRGGSPACRAHLATTAQATLDGLVATAARVAA